MEFSRAFNEEPRNYLRMRQPPQERALVAGIAVAPHNDWEECERFRRLHDASEET